MSGWEKRKLSHTIDLHFKMSHVFSQVVKGAHSEALGLILKVESIFILVKGLAIKVVTNFLSICSFTFTLDIVRDLEKKLHLGGFHLKKWYLNPNFCRD